jgi:hypothetical protein
MKGSWFLFVWINVWKTGGNSGKTTMKIQFQQFTLNLSGRETAVTLRSYRPGLSGKHFPTVTLLHLFIA